MNEREKIIGSIEHVIYQNENFSIITIELKTGELITLKGYNLPDSKDHVSYEFFGKFTEDKKYGRTFKTDYYEIDVRSKNDIIKYLSRNIDGIGVKTAEKFYDMYGSDTLEALKDYGKITAIINSNAKAEKIYRSAKLNLNDRELFFLLMKYEIPISTIRKIADDLENAKEKIEVDPFILSEFHIPFSKLNKMSIELNCDLKADSRVAAGIRYVLNETIASQGHLFSSYDDVVEKTLQILNYNAPDKVSKENINHVLRKMLNERNLSVEKYRGQLRIYDTQNYESEKYICSHLLKLITKEQKKYSANDLKPYIKRYEKKYNIYLSEKQKLAILTVMNNNCSIITGSAGTGKTTVLKFCIHIFRDLFKSNDIALLAPTGRAARRMAEATGYDAKTIHSKLGISKEGEVTGEIEEDIVFVDEMSMCGNNIFYKLLANSYPHTKYVLIGDPQQLPSVEAGNILKDLIESGIIPVVKLDVIYRQMRESLIISNANKIVKGIADFKTGNDFIFEDVTGSREIQKRVLDIFCSELFENVKNINEIQIITPMKERGYLCAKSLNLAIQEAINPKKENECVLKVNGYEFRALDKVICQKNTDEVKNGEIGNIVAINDNEVTIEFYGDELTFSRDDLKELNFALAYAITVHKSQGSEFNTVILPINYENKIMLKRNLLYTAVTRASSKMIIVGSRNHYWDAVRNNVVAPRNTALSAKLKHNYIRATTADTSCDTV